MFLKVSTDLAILISRGKSFQTLGTAATKAQSPRVVKVLKFWSDSRMPSLDRSLYLVFKGLIFYKIIDIGWC